MKIAIFSKKPFEEILKEKVEKHGFKYSDTKPDIVLSIGGDGTYLRAERKYPKKPVLIIKDSSICRKCETDKFDEALEKLQKEKYKIKENMELETKIRRRKMTCVNEFSVRNRYATTALRFYVWINDKRTDEIIGDGVVICTPFGSTGYYSSLGGKNFKKGIGVGFNNPTIKMEHLVVPENSKIKVKIIRGDAVFNSDNDPKVILLKKNEMIKIRKSKETTKIVDI
jgi:NAD+ kinase